MRLGVIIGVFLLLTTAAFAVEPCLDGGCEVVYGDTECGDCLAQCYPCTKPYQPVCPSCTPDCEPRCQPVCSEPCTQACTPRCDLCLKGKTEIPLAPVSFHEIDPECCPGDEFRLLPCLDVCTEYTLCCGGDDFRLLCKCECECVPEPKCRQNTCTPAPDCGKCSH